MSHDLWYTYWGQVKGAEGANYDSSCGDPGDGFGVLKYAADTSLHASLSITGLDDAMITAHSREVADSAKQAGRWATDARDAALNAVATTDITAARLFAGNAESILTNALNGFDADADGTAERITGEGGAKQAYWAAQDMATFTLGAKHRLNCLSLPRRETPASPPWPRAPSG